MNNNSKLKKTSVGWISVEWPVKKIEDIAQVTSGGTPDREKLYYWNGNIPWIRTAEVQNCKLFSHDVKEYITDKGLQDSSAKVIPANSILLAMIGQGKTRGQVALLTFPAATNQNCGAIILKHNYCPEFFFHFLLSQYEKIRELSNNAGQSNLNSGSIRALRVPVPPLPEQIKIAQILSTWDKAITQTQQLIEAKQRLKQGLMQQLLTGRMRFKEFGEPVKRTDQLPQGWSKKKLADISQRIERDVSGQTDLVLSITAKVGFVDQQEKFSRIIAGENIVKYVLLKNGEFSYNKGNSKSYPQGCIYRLDEFEQGAVPQVYYSFSLNLREADSDYFKYYFESGSLNHQLSRIINAGVRNDGLLNLNAKDFFSVSVLLPSLDEQKVVANLLNSISQQIIQLKDYLKFTQTQKQGLMQVLLTGKVRINKEVK
jgi:type I restriction enzyme S subunit